MKAFDPFASKVFPSHLALEKDQLEPSIVPCRLVFFLLASLFAGTFGCTSAAPKDPGSYSTTAETAVQEREMKIMAPFEHVRVAPQIYTIQPDADTVLTFPGGSSVQISAGSFVNEQNEAITKPVEIHFREFHNAAEVITSGIPMEAVPGQGSDDCFQTAGMFEIKGYAAGQPVKIAAGKSMTVDLRSEAKENSYDFWKYDPQTGGWVNQAPGSQVNIQAAQPATTSGKESGTFAAIAPPAPPANSQTDPRTPLQIKGLPMDVQTCPDLRGKKTQPTLLYAGKNAKTAELKALGQIHAYRWLKSSLKPTADPNQYTLLLEGDTTLKIPVVLAFSGQEFQTRQTAYERLLADYKNGIARQLYLSQVEAQQENITRGMQIQGFGIYNYDFCYHRNDMMQVAGDFDFGIQLEPALRERVLVFLIAGNARAVIKYPVYAWNDFRFSRSDRNCLVAVLPDGRVATLSQRKFNEACTEMVKGQRFVFKMTLRPTPIANVDELQSIIAPLTI